MHRVLFTQCYFCVTMHAVLCTRYPLPLAFVVPGATRCNSCAGGAGAAQDRASLGRSKVGNQGRRGCRGKGCKQRPAGEGIQPFGMHGQTAEGSIAQGTVGRKTLPCVGLQFDTRKNCLAHCSRFQITIMKLYKRKATQLRSNADSFAAGLYVTLSQSIHTVCIQPHC